MIYKNHSKNSKINQVNSLYSTYKELMNAAGSNHKILKKCLVLTIFSSIFFGIALALTYPLFLFIQNNQNYKLNNIFLIIITILIILSIICNWFASNYDHKGYALISTHELKTNLGEHLRKIPLEKLSKKRAGELNSLLLDNVNESSLYTFSIAKILIFPIFLPLSSSIVILFFNWKLSLVMMIVFPIIIPLYLWRRKAFRRGFSYLAEANTKLRAEAVEFVQGLPILKSTGNLSNKINQYQKVAKEVCNLQIIGDKKGKKPNLIIIILVQFALFLIIFLGCIFVLKKSMSPLLLATVIIIIARCSNLLNVVVLLGSLFEVFMIGYKRLMEFFDIKPLFQPNIKKLNKPKTFEIKFENVSFAYETNKKDVLKNINLKIEENKLTALVGESGCGKTTLTRLIMRYADVKQGKISIGGIDIRQIPQEKIMDLISVVFQDVYLFNDTIYNNIKMGKKDAKMEDIIKVSKKAQCHDFIMKLPKNYHTQINELGSKLSGGEKQRISIARSLLKDSPIIILDEPTSFLDTENEIRVQKAINELVKNRTVIVIAHRISTIINANKIVVIKNSTIKEEGNHSELLKNHSEYYNFWNIQKNINQ